MLFGEEPAGTTEPGLNLVENQNNVVARTNLAHRFEITCGRNNHPRLALDGFDQEGDRISRDRPFECGGVAKRHNAAEATGEGTEAVARDCIGAKADDGQGTTVEVVGADDDFGPVFWDTLYLIAPFTRDLDCAFHRFGARVHGQNLVRTGGGAELLAEQRELVVHEGARSNSEPRRLLGQCRQDARVTMPLIDRRICRQTIEVTPAVDIPNPDAMATGEHDIERLVIVRAVLVLKGAIAVARSQRKILQHHVHFEPRRSVRSMASHYSAARSNALASALR